MWDGLDGLLGCIIWIFFGVFIITLPPLIWFLTIGFAAITKGITPTVDTVTNDLVRRATNRGIRPKSLSLFNTLAQIIVGVSLAVYGVLGFTALLVGLTFLSLIFGG